MGTTPRAAGALIGLLAIGCHVQERYDLGPAQAAQLVQLDEGTAAQTAVGLLRSADRRPVYVRADALRAGTQEGAVRHTRRYSPMVTAGVVLTVFGAVLSIAGTIVYFTTEGDLKLAGGLVALAAEPPMITGSVLWPLGLVRRPQEVAPGRADVRYLDLTQGPAEPSEPLAPLTP